MLIIDLVLMHADACAECVQCLVWVSFCKIRETLPLFDLLNNVNVFPLNSKSLLNTCSVAS